MDGARASDSYPTVVVDASLVGGRQTTTSRRVVMVAWKVAAQAAPELPSVQIAVVVANTQVRTLRTEAGKGST